MASCLLLRGIDTKADMRVKFRRLLKFAWGSLLPRDFCSDGFAHGGEGEIVRQRFFVLPGEDRRAAVRVPGKL